MFYILFMSFIYCANKNKIYLWEEGKMPCKRTYSASSGYSDPPDFQPFIEYYPAIGKIKGAIMICPGGAFQFRSMYSEGYNVADRLSKLGYQCFVVSYRLVPYTQQEGALDLQRAVRYVRKNADLYQIDPKSIAVVGFSAGGILCGELCLYWKDLTNAKKLDNNYVPDELDNINSTVSAIGHVYSFYGRLSVSNNNVDTLRNARIPPSFYAYGTRDPFYRQFIQNAEASRSAGAIVEEHVFEGQPHGFGAGNSNSNWIPLFDAFLKEIFSSNGQKTTNNVPSTINPTTTITNTLQISNSEILTTPPLIVDDSDENLQKLESINNNKKSVWWIAVIVVGVVAISVIIAVVIYIMKKKHAQIGTQSIELENDLLNGKFDDNNSNSI